MVDSNKRMVIVDQDAGVDDALALAMVMSHPDIHLLAITCVNGNVPLKQVSSNVGRVLEQWSKEHLVPVYEGANCPLVNPIGGACHYHGKDGLGEVTHLYPLQRWKGIEKEHAVTAMIRLARDYPNQVTLLAVGPLTNLALAARLDPEFPSLLKDVIIMGGNVQGRGNSGIAAEFNFHADPESAHIVLQEYKKPLLVTLESCTSFSIDLNWCKSWLDYDSSKAKFMKSIWQFSLQIHASNGQLFNPYDAAAAAVLLHSDFVTEKQDVYAQVELTGQLTRGQMVVDWKKKLGKEPNIRLALKYNVSILQDLLVKTLKA